MTDRKAKWLTAFLELMKPWVKLLWCLSLHCGGRCGRDSINEALRLIVDGSHSRIPAYRDSIDNIVGILYAKDIF